MIISITDETTKENIHPFHSYGPSIKATTILIPFTLDPHSVKSLIPRNKRPDVVFCARVFGAYVTASVNVRDTSRMELRRASSCKETFAIVSTFGLNLGKQESGVGFFVNTERNHRVRLHLVLAGDVRGLRLRWALVASFFSLVRADFTALCRNAWDSRSTSVFVHFILVTPFSPSSSSSSHLFPLKRGRMYSQSPSMSCFQGMFRMLRPFYNSKFLPVISAPLEIH